MHQLIALVGLPVALLLTTTGLGLLAERVVRARLPDALLAPLGFCVATSLLLAIHRLGGDLTVAAPVLVAGTIAGFALAGSALRSRINPGWPGLAGLAVYALYAAPVLLSGNWTWSGYNFLNDTAVQFLLIEHLKDAGTDLSSLPSTTGADTVRQYLASGYPIGAHAFAATLAGLLGSGPEVVYQGFLAGMAALAAMSIAVLGARTAFSARTAAIVAGVALAANLTYNTGLQGSIKELGVIAALAAATALARELVAADAPLGVAALFGVSLAAILSVYSAAGIPYIGALGLTVALVLVLVHRRDALGRRWIASGGLALGVAAVLAAPVIASIVDFYSVASHVVDATAPLGDVLGQLAAPLPLLQAGGIWLDGAYQTPISPSMRAEQLTYLGLWAVAGLALLSLVEIVRRRCPEALLAIVPTTLTAALVAPGVVPYADAKLMAIMSPSIIFAAALGLLFVARIPRPIGPAVAVAAAVGLGGAIAVSDGFALHDSKIAPRERMVALRDVTDRLAGQGVVMFNEFEEFAKHFGDGALMNVATEPITPRRVELRRPEGPFGKYFDLDLQTLEYVDSFPNIVMRRSPAASRPPASYERVFANEYYETWRRSGRLEPVAHLPLQRLDSATDEASCEEISELVRRGRRESADMALVAARMPDSTRLDILEADRSGGLLPDLSIPGAVTTINPGFARGRVRIARAGTYRLWLRGSFPRATHVLVDGRRRMTVEGADTPGQWSGDVALRLSAGAHRVEVRVPRGAPKPGDGGAVTIGPVLFVQDAPRRLDVVALSRWRTLCGRELDWVELVRRNS